MAPVLLDRLQLLDSITLDQGGHESFELGVCALEAAAWLAGEEHSDHPACVCPVIGTFLRSWNDSLRTNEDRDRLLKPLLPKVLDTKSTPEVELARVMLCIDWFVREWLPSWLDLTPALAESVATLRALKPIQSWEDFDAAQAAIFGARDKWDAARDAAWDAARDAAWAAARDAARDAARAAARDAAWDAAWAAAWAAARDAARDAAWAAARDAARDAARAAARDAAWAAAWDAAWDAARDAADKHLAPTVDRLQQSAVALVERMAAVRE